MIRNANIFRHCLKSFLAEKDPGNKFLEQASLHIHVPEVGV